ncbi:LLM class flavin-dependent oxidoreductase [Nocardioides litoris]|uniref:LLM class flavin-dependent oxidoreductase n=1 Tax=Nocardioides litoris TaxID=1926648 RepID=UPI0011213F3C|nr:LLM class flavin-dependent oxidoreductase [Nocardioides litoris]
MTTSPPAAGPRLAACWPFTPLALTETARWSQLTRTGAYQRLWVGQSAGLDVASTVAHAAGAGHRFPLGIAVNVIPLHHPVQAAQQARSMVLASGHDLRLCFSPGDPAVQRAFGGSAYASPLTAAREFLAAVRALVDGDPTRLEGDYFPLAAGLPGPRLPARVLLGLGTLRPRMARLAGEVADVATTWLTPPSYVRDVIAPALAEGASAADRPRPELVVPVHAVLAQPGRDVAALAEQAVGTHLRLPHYRAVLEAAGDHAALRDGPAGAIASGLVTCGGVDDIAARVLDAVEAGADEVPLVLHRPPGPWAAVRDEWLAVGEVVAACLDQLAPAPAPPPRGVAV